MKYLKTICFCSFFAFGIGIIAGATVKKMETMGIEQVRAGVSPATTESLRRSEFNTAQMVEHLEWHLRKHNEDIKAKQSRNAYRLDLDAGSSHLDGKGHGSVANGGER